MELSLLFDSNRTGHNDLFLRFAGQIYICDSYYLALDGELMPDIEKGSEVRVSLRRLLEQWYSAIETVPEGGSVYLPYDFSDQYTAWLHCTRSGDTVTIVHGHTDLEGWSISPSALGQHMFRLPRFQPNGPPVQTLISDLIEGIRKSMAQNA